MQQKKSFQLFFLLLKKINFFFLFFIFFFIYIFIYYFFQIKVIEIEGKSSFIDFKSILVNELKNKNLIFLSEKNEEKKLKDNYSYVKNIFIEKKLPNRIFIKIEFYSPLAIIKNNQGFFILSSDGRILHNVSGKKNFLPMINYYQLINNLIYKTGDFLDFNDLKISLQLLEKMEDLNLKVETIDIKSEDMILFNLKNSQEIIFTSKKDIKKQFFSVLSILKHLRVEGKKFKKIDARFDKIIIKF